MYKLAKPFLFACLLGSVAVFTSCNDGDEGDDFVAAEIEGSWSFNSFNFSATINGTDFLQWWADKTGQAASNFEDAFEELGNEINEFEGMTITFNADGTVISSYPGEPEEEGTWVLTESTQTLTLNFGDRSTGDDVIELDVVTLTSSALVVSFGESDEFDIDGDEIIDELAFVVTLGLTK